MHLVNCTQIKVHQLVAAIRQWTFTVAHREVYIHNRENSCISSILISNSVRLLPRLEVQRALQWVVTSRCLNYIHVHVLVYMLIDTWDIDIQCTHLLDAAVNDCLMDHTQLKEFSCMNTHTCNIAYYMCQTMACATHKSHWATGNVVCGLHNCYIHVPRSIIYMYM